ncbi:MAG: diaminopimelate decarboxylase [Rikenellaceae bacterium]|nr:diaminopimelate decarboxylase [Rikenellaceae bacterium]
MTEIGEIEGIDTPFYLYDIDLLRRTLQKVCDNASRYGFFVHYALKANFEPRILQEVKSFRLGTDCVSGGEVRASVEAGFDPAGIVFAGVGKRDDEIEYALEKGIFAFNCESLEELEVIDGIAAKSGRRARVALRINPDVDPQTHKNISTGQADSKFGIAYTEIEEAIERAESLRNTDIVGLHFHIGSQITNLKVFEYLCKRVVSIMSWFEGRGVKITYVNVGGGLGINYESPRTEPIPDFDTYFRIFADNLPLRPDQTLHFELGRSIVAQCGALITKVLYNKKTASGKNYVLVDASMTELIRPALYGAHHHIENLTPHDGTEVYSIAGGVCESSDIFARDITLPVTERGDLLALHSAGAYGQSMASCYNMRPLPRSVYYTEVDGIE